MNEQLNSVSNIDVEGEICITMHNESVESIVINEILDQIQRETCTEKECIRHQLDQVDSPVAEYMDIDKSTLHIPPYKFHNFHNIAKAESEFITSNQQNNFLKGCKWSPDGTCLLTNSDDNILRLFELPLCLYEQNMLTSRISALPELSSVLKVKHGGTVYDFCWFPYMTSLDPQTCCFVSTSSQTPVQLWDAFTGELRATYKGIDQYDEVTAAYSVAFSPTGEKLYCGYYNSVKIFASNRPGRDCNDINIKKAADQRGIVSCIAVNPYISNMFAIGTYRNSVGIYSDDGAAICILQGQKRGLTHIQFSPDGSLLYTGGRKHNDILCWDLRNSRQVLYTLQRSVLTNQRIYFDITNDGKYVVSGSTNGVVTVWDATTVLSSDFGNELKPTKQWTAHKDCTNGISIHKHLPLLATCSGQRHVEEICDNDDVMNAENCVKLWWIGPKENGL